VEHRRYPQVGFVLALAVALTATTGSQTPPTNAGAAAAWEKILKLRTTVSVMHVTAHPDDEHGGVLAKLSRGDGARVTLLTLTRGESGDNAIGPQLFDALGLIRTEELHAASRSYGVDQQYFTTVVDYGFSKRLEESLEKWDPQYVMRDVVRIVRMERPTIILSRFQGNVRDGHGNHQAAGIMARAAFQYASDPNQFPEQIAEGLRPWRPIKAYIGGVREDEDWTVRINTGEYSAMLGDSYENVARWGLSLQRSQNSGRMTTVADPNWVYYQGVGSGPGVVDVRASKETSLFDGLPRNIEDAIGAVGRPIDEAVAQAMKAFTESTPSASAPMLAQGLRLTREAMATSIDPQVKYLLAIKEQQFQDAINAALGARLTATPLMATVVPGQTFRVNVRFEGPPSAKIALRGDPGWAVKGTEVTLADDVAISTKPYFFRNGLQESRYTLRDASEFGRPVGHAPLVASAAYMVGGVEVTLETPVRVGSVPRLSVTMEPGNAIVPFDERSTDVLRSFYDRGVQLQISLLHNAERATAGQVVLKMPDGWKSEPTSHPFSFAKAGERSSYRFTVRPSAMDAKPYTIEAIATAAGREYREGYEVIEHRDLEVRYLYRPSTAEVRRVNVATVAGLKVGYVMGIGDQVPLGLQQLGAEVTLLGETELASADLSRFDAIMTGTRAYAVRDDLKTDNARLLDYVKAGGNMIVLYNTQELVPNTFAPFPGELPRAAEEVSEEDSPVSILAPRHQSFTWPNKITAADFNGWIEQRGSKFFTKWDAAYTPMISTFDKGQAPQRGGWLTARVGKGNWTYFAYALHRQLPYGVSGAYRITANLLALGKQPR